MKSNLKKMFPALMRVGMTQEEIETLADEVPNAHWWINVIDDGKVFVVSCKNKDSVAWLYKSAESGETEVSGG